MDNGSRPPQAGFTLIEMVIVLGVMILIAGAIFADLAGSGRQQKLDAERNRFASALQDARGRSVSQEDGNQWGVYVDGANNFYSMFEGASYGSGTTTAVIYLPSGVQFVSPVGTTTVSFAKGTGTTTAATFIIALTTNQAASGTITVDPGGTVSY